jgi:hypothetical protein
MQVVCWMWDQMGTVAYLAGTGASPPARTPFLIRTTLVGARAWILKVAIWVDTCAHAYATAALYTHLCRLSDAELQRRGLARHTIARDLLESTIGRTGSRQ